MPDFHVITGATGLIGSYIAEQLVSEGMRVRAVVRPSSNVRFLEQLGVECVHGELHDMNSLRIAIAGANVLYHCAGKVDDWGPWSEFQRDVLGTTRNVMQAARDARVRRVVHVSSMAAYGHPRLMSRKLTEDDPVAQRLRVWDYYALAKARSEDIARECIPTVTIVRPTWSYGERERNSFPRIISALRRGKAALLGSGDNLLNLVHARDIAIGIILSARSDPAAGQIYNLCSEGEITQHELYDLIADELQLPRVRKKFPLRMAYVGAFAMECWARATKRGKPLISRHGISLICRPTRFSIDKARTQLGWRPTISARDGIPQMLRSIVPSGQVVDTADSGSSRIRSAAS